MLKPEKMAKIRIICLKDHLKEIIEELHKSKAINIIDHSKDENIDIGIPLEESAKLSEITITVRKLISQLKIYPSDNITPADLSAEKLKDAICSIQRLQNDVIKIESVEKDSSARLKILEENAQKLEDLEKLGISPEHFGLSKTLTHFIGYVDDTEKFESDMISSLKENYDISHSDNKGKALVCVFVEKTKEMQALKVLQQHKYSEFKIPEDFSQKKSLSAKIVTDEIKDLKMRNRESKEKLVALREKWSKRLPEIEKALMIIIKKAEAPLKFGETKHIAIISGWVPEYEKVGLITKLTKLIDDKIIVEELDINEEEDIPIKLNNSKIVAPYEVLLKLYSLPNFHEIDPTLFMYFTFPIFFGFMLGDIGYGLVVLIGALILKKMRPAWSQFMNIMSYSAISTIIFGVLFGEVFGLEKIGHLHLWHILSRMESIIELMIVSLVIGVIHINLGLILGFINEMHHGLKRAILEKGSWFVLEVGIALLILSNLKQISLAPLVGYIILAIAVIMLYFGEGVKGIIEIPAIFTNILSYLRLMAIGIASVALTMVINEQSAPLFSMGIIGIIGGIIIMIFGHTINLALGLIGPFLHSLRLHYVEHFTKYYKGGGKEFKAFGVE